MRGSDRGSRLREEYRKLACFYGGSALVLGVTAYVQAVEGKLPWVSLGFCVMFTVATVIAVRGMRRRSK